MGTAAVLEGARGAIVVPEDIDAFADAAARVLADPGERRRLSGEARDFVAANWSSREMARRMLALYRSTLAGKALSAASGS